jgi:tetratricopeptide (TPR) repeat protein
MIQFAWECFNKGNTLSNQKKHEEAIKCYDQALQLDPEYINAWNNKGYTLGRLRKYEAAIKCFNKVLEFDHDDAYAKAAKEKALKALGKLRYL